MSTLLKNLFIALGLAILLFIGYIVFIREDADSEFTDNLGSESSVEAELETQRLLTTLSELRSLSVQGDIFDDPLFLSLRDFRNNLGEESSGRSNPFLPVQ